MGVIQGGKIIEGSGLNAPILNAGAPSAGTDEVQTLTLGSTWLAGETFKLVFNGEQTGAIAWSATNATLLANIQAALDAMNTLAANDIVAAADTLTAGIGTITLTAGGNYAKHPIDTLTVADNTSADGTAAIAETTPGVEATARGAAKGGLLIDVTNAMLYINTGTLLAPTWTKVGTQS